MSTPRKKRNAGGRPPALTPEILNRTVQYLPAVLYLETLAGLLEVDRTTMFRWMRRGRKEASRLSLNSKAKPKESERLYLEFYHAIKKGLAIGELNALLAIRHAANRGSWQAAAWLLERRYPERPASEVPNARRLSSATGK
ncbi:hypothetical protein [Tuwongella immobilis]|uniref:Uncharacterized protein n=1 Tax=Tuwongella immobilis TaxID=692036 RepID=A0A6C2YQ38_9BACT|nr:hypothetical protein [Tuwongella immobilis]VIP03002.1 Putative phage protein OS=Geobacillus thermodenitrificans (strain NG80-2) GN=GTNG_2830 PE=4 SV=1 [Tuwongella immobilis]VTS03094.1 Putative phage protein OS=Geobacillus thermodenitrificans (strain NG80-2) GN=GTNG_2830 PE=4 SV=1 [Tuwongella immobilis]